MAKDFVQAIPLSTIDSAALIAPTFIPINSDGIPEACFMLKIINDSATTILVSYDKSTRHDAIAPKTSAILGMQEQSQGPNKRALFKKGTVVSVRTYSGGASVGLVHLSGYFQK